MISMKKAPLLAGLGLLAILAGCGGGKTQKNSVKQAALCNMPLDMDTTKLARFDEDLDMFVLEDQDLFKAEDMKMAANEEKLDFDWHSGCTEDLATVFYGYDCRNPRKDQKDNMSKADALAMKLHKEGKKVCLKGHACQYHGTAQYNIAISQDRAQDYAKHLVKECGIPADCITCFGVGKEEPMVMASTKEQNAPNRRIELYGIEA